MPARLFTITPESPTSIKVEPGKEGTFAFVVTCLGTPGSAYDVVLQALRIGSDGTGREVDWLIVGPQRSLHISGGDSRDVTIAVRPTDISPHGPSTIELAVAPSDRPAEPYDVSSPVTCELLAAPPPPPPPPPTTPPPPRTRPGGLTALAVLNFVFAGIVALGLLIINSGTRNASAFKWLSLLLVGLLIASGVGYLLQKRILGRFVGSAYGGFALITALVGAAELDSGSRNIIFIGLPYPILTLILLNTIFKKNLVR